MDARCIDLLLKRNNNHDGEEKKVTYTGFDLCWPDGSPTCVKFAKFCKIGIRTIFGRKPVANMNYTAQFFFTPVDKEHPFSKGRRMFLKKEAGIAQMYLPGGEPTHMTFSQTDDKRILYWLGWDSLNENEVQWFDFEAKTC